MENAGISGKRRESFFAEYYESAADVDDRIDVFTRCLAKYREYHSSWIPGEESRVAELLSPELWPWSEKPLFHDRWVQDVHIDRRTDKGVSVGLYFKGKDGDGFINSVIYSGVGRFSFCPPVDGMLIGMSEIFGVGSLVRQIFHMVGQGRIEIDFYCVNSVRYW